MAVARFEESGVNRQKRMKAPFSPPLEFPELDLSSSNLGGTNH
jgi:hypothetical protein